MRKIRVFAHASLDGVISPGGPNDDSEYANGGWTVPFRSPAGAAMVVEAYGERFDLLLGRRTYDQWSGFWPKAPASPMSDRLNAATKYVLTHRPESLPWGPAQGIGPDVVEAVRGLKSTEGLDLVVSGSTSLTTTLLEQGLVDELVLAVYPVLLGRGKRFFSDEAGARELAFVSSKSTPTGVLLNTYRCGGAGRS
jgi:dihydrofolate reductase